MGMSRWDNNTVVLEEQGFVIFFIGKVANSSMKVALLTALGIPRKDFNEWVDKGGGRMGAVHGRWLKYVSAKDVVEKYNHFFKVAFVRNPWDRLVSCWMNKTVVKLHPRFATYGCYLEMPFDEFVEKICKVSDEDSDTHIVQQHVPMMHEGKFIPDWVGRFESLTSDWGFVRVLMRDKIALPILETDWGKTQHLHYRQLYTPYTMALVRDRYIGDINMFDYEF